MLNKYNNTYDFIPAKKPLEKPTRGFDTHSGRYTLNFNNDQVLTCAMDWNGTKTLDNLQVFIVFKYSNIVSAVNDGNVVDSLF